MHPTDPTKAEISRRNFVKNASAVGAALATTSILGPTLTSAQTPTPSASSSTSGFWPNGARIAVSFSLMFEAGGQPISGAGGPITEPIKNGLPDLPTNSYFEYGMTEGVPRLLDLFDKYQIKISSFMIGQAVEKHPELAAEIVKRGHEAGAHGRVWSPSYDFPPEKEKEFISDCVATIKRVTGFQPVGWNAYWLRNSVHTLEILQDLGFIYHIDDPSSDEPFIVPVRKKPFVTVPYTLHLNDISGFSVLTVFPSRI